MWLQCTVEVFPIDIAIVCDPNRGGAGDTAANEEESVSQTPAHPELSDVDQSLSSSDAEEQPGNSVQMRFLFERKEHSKLYEKYMIREPEAVLRMILSYLEDKKGKPFGMAVDVGCGTGHSTRILAPYFEKVVGVDISESQIQEAESVISPSNVSYMIAKAEELPFEERSLDLVTASVAAHWFDLDKFSEEVNRVLKPSGCLAMYCLDLQFSLVYKDCSEKLTDVFNEAIYFLSNEYKDELSAISYTRYKNIFDALPFEDKTRVTDIYHKRQISIAALKGFVESLCLYQSYYLADPEAAQEFLQKLQGSLLKNTGESSTDTELEICNSYTCILACPSPKRNKGPGDETL
ncbi:putative methyltransferase DDB_G0268948 [Lissotriton helveticus]